MMQEAVFLPRPDLDRLFDALQREGYRCVGPQVRDGTLVFDTLSSAEALPREMGDHQAPGHYTLGRRPGPRRFAWANGPQALKPLTFAPEEPLWSAARSDAPGIAFQRRLPTPEPTAVIGVRACDLAALALQEQHFAGDPWFETRRRALLLVAVHCTHPADTCFCASTGDGPAARSGFDLALHELDDGYLVQAGSAAGEAVRARLPLRPATLEQRQQAQSENERAAAAQVRALPGRDLEEVLFARLDHPRWSAVGERCLACGNCTSVCPTCFCHNEEEVPALDGHYSLHRRLWDSCFTAGHSQLHGFILRGETGQRYRQWLTHKLGAWHSQYGRSGCVGCGRCITWCPVGIDLTEEVTAICGGNGDV